MIKLTHTKQPPAIPVRLTVGYESEAGTMLCEPLNETGNLNTLADWFCRESAMITNSNNSSIAWQARRLIPSSPRK
jgi:hypothetical protein